jgi:hypothetical protein
LSKAGDAGQDLVGALGPDKGVAWAWCSGDKFSNRGLQLRDAAVHASTELFVGELGEPALDEVEPRPVGRREVDMKALPLAEPVSDQRGFMGPVPAVRERLFTVFNELPNASLTID